jgi:hypothetical protein
MPHSKYEIRSSQVQEVLSKPPGFLTLWGNTLLFLLLAAALMWVCNLRLHVRETIPCTIKSVNAGKPAGRKVLTIVSARQVQMPIGKKILLILNRETGMETPIACVVNDIWNQDGNGYLLVSYDNRRMQEMPVSPNMTGKIRIETTDFESGLEMLKRKILFK